MSEISDAIQAKCLAFGDRIIKLNDFLLEQAASKRYDGGSQMADRRGKTQTSSVRLQTSLGAPLVLLWSPSARMTNRHTSRTTAPGTFAGQTRKRA